MTTIDLTSRWLPLRAHPERGGLPLFCFPHAGGGASAYRGWRGQMSGVDVLPVQPPGREARLREAAHHHMAPLVTELASVIAEAAGSGPYAVYGHSLGALVAFETVREIRRRGEAEPVHLIVSGCAAPHCTYDDGTPVSQMSQPQLADMLRRLGGTPEWLLADPELLQMILPAVRADFSVKDTYVYLPEDPLDIPVTVVSSTADPRASRDLQERWAEQTTAEFRMHTMVGGHFAIFEREDLTHGYFAEALSPWAAAS